MLLHCFKAFLPSSTLCLHKIPTTVRRNPHFNKKNNLYSQISLNFFKESVCIQNKELLEWPTVIIQKLFVSEQ